MSSETTMMAEQYRLREWADQIRDCQSRPSGMSVVSWCACHGITRLMQLRGKVFGRQRTILGRDPAGMDVPIQIDKELYFEAKFDTEALLTMMEKKVLEPVGYDFSGIIIQYTEKKLAMSESLKSVQDEGREEAPEEEQSGGMTLS